MPTRSWSTSFVIAALLTFAFSAEPCRADCLFTSPFSCIKQSNYGVPMQCQVQSYGQYPAQNFPIWDILDILSKVKIEVGTSGGGGASTGDLAKANETLNRIDSKVGQLEELLKTRLARNEKDIERLVESQDEVAKALDGRINKLAEIVKTNTGYIEENAKSRELIMKNTDAILFQQQQIKGILKLAGPFEPEVPLAAGTEVFVLNAAGQQSPNHHTMGMISVQNLADFEVNGQKWQWVRFANDYNGFVAGYKQKDAFVKK